MPGYVPADAAILAEGRRRALLTRLLSSGGRARVVNPDHPDGGWEGKVVGLVDWPSVVIEGDGGRRWTVPQHFAIEEIGAPETAKKIYLAARYSRRVELCGYRADLEALGIEVTSRWLNGSHQLDNQGIPITDDGERRFEAGDPSVDHLRAHFATEDVADVLAAEVLVAFTEEPRVANSRGGRHVELGIALASGKHVVVIGPRENVFCWLPQVEHHADWPSFASTLGGARPGPAENAADRPLADWERELLLEQEIDKLTAAEAKLAKVREWAERLPYRAVAGTNMPPSAPALRGEVLAILDGPEPGPAVSQVQPRPTAAETALSQAKAALHRLACDEDMAEPNMTERESRCAYARDALAAIAAIESESGAAEGHGCQHPEVDRG